MHHLRSGARNPQPTRAPGGLNDFNYGEKYLLPAGGARPAGWGQRRPDGSPGPPHNPRPPEDGPAAWGEGAAAGPRRVRAGLRSGAFGRVPRAADAGLRASEPGETASEWRVGGFRTGIVGRSVAMEDVVGFTPTRIV